MSITGLGHSTIYALVQKREFPEPVKLTGKSSAWNLAEVESWQAARLAERSAKPRTKQNPAKKRAQT